MKLAFLFPGQGSQAVGMGMGLGAMRAAIDKTLQEADNALGFALSALIKQGPKEDLDKTEFTQPALLAMSVAMFRAWQVANGTKPDVLIGHSLGEYSALVAASALDFGDALRLVRLRGQAMQRAVPAGSGAMAAVLGGEEGTVQECCAEAGSVGMVSIANYNGGGQIVIAGESAAVAKASELLKAKGIRRVLPLAVSVPSHCALMRPAADELAAALDKITLRTPLIPVVNNVRCQTETNAAAIRAALVEQLYSPVRFAQGIEGLRAQGVVQFAECGPGKVLSGLVKRINEGVQPESEIAIYTLEEPAAFSQALEQL
jgi:[acyl-carrier-protein] S-malonyltransferase